MHRRTSTKTNDFELETQPPWSRIRFLGIKLRSIAHLLGTQAVNEDPPLDMLEVQWGCGLLLEDIASGIREISDEMEQNQIRKLGKKF